MKAVRNYKSYNCRCVVQLQKKKKNKEIKIAIKVEKDHLDVPEEWEEYPQLGDYSPDDPTLDRYDIYVNGEEVFIFTNKEAYLEWASGMGNLIEMFNIYRYILYFSGYMFFEWCKEVGVIFQPFYLIKVNVQVLNMSFNIAVSKTKLEWATSRHTKLELGLGNKFLKPKWGMMPLRTSI